MSSLRTTFKTLMEIYQEDVLLMEGLQYSHRADITLKHTIQTFGNLLLGKLCRSSLESFNGREYNTKEYVELVSRVRLKHNQDVIKHLDIYGYHFGSDKVLTSDQKQQLKINASFDVFVTIFEAKYPTQIERYKLSADLFHVTRTKNVEKIMTLGLLPKFSTTMFHHPGNRIYLLSTQHPESDLPTLINLLHINTKTPKEKFVKLMIKNYHPEHEQFFCDPNLSWGDLSLGSRGVFVHRGIHPRHIELMS